MGREQEQLVILLKANGIPFSGAGSKVYEIDVPKSRLGQAVRILQTNRLVIERKFVLATNTLDRP